MKRLILFALLMTALIAFVTNPSKEDYLSQVKEELSDGGHPILGMVSGPIVRHLTSEKDYWLFSVYETKLSEDSTEYARAIGVFDHIYWLRQPDFQTEK